jgi:ATP-binding cassette subfamily B protein
MSEQTYEGLKRAVSEASQQSQIEHAFAKKDKANLTAEEIAALTDDYPAFAGGPEHPEFASGVIYIYNEGKYLSSDEKKALEPIMSDAWLALLKMMAQVQPEMTGGVDIASLPDSMQDQAAYSAVLQTYKNLGMNTSAMQTHYLLIAGLKMLAVSGVSVVTAIFVGLLAALIGSGVALDLRGRMFTKVVSFSNAEFDKYSTASLITRTTNDIQQVEMLVIMALRMLLYAPIIATGGVWKVLHTDTDMAWIIAVGVGTLLAVIVVLLVIALPKFKLMQTLVDRINLVMREILTGLPVVRAFSREKHEAKRFDAANIDLTKTNLFVNRVMTFMWPIMMLIMNGITVLILWNGGHGIDSGSLQVGDMMAFIQYAMQIIFSFLMISMLSVILPRALISVGRIGDVLENDPTVKEPSNPVSLNDNKRGLVEFDHVSFRYPGAEENAVYDITFTAQPGQTTAIIGSTGCGKTTVVNLIPRFYDVTAGTVRVSGVDVRNADSGKLRERISFVPQKGVLFSGTIESNIRYGAQEASDAEVEHAASIAQATEFIDEKEEKYASVIAQGGANVSGGQKQRLAIARAVAKKPDIYVCDDSFSALDYKTDTALRKRLKEETGDATVILVAQRIGTIVHAEQILVLDDGRIVGSGTHAELMLTCDTYRQIAESQLSEKELETFKLKEVGNSG